MPLAVVPLKEKLLIYGGSLLLTLVIYTVIDLYVPAKQLFSGQQMSFKQVLTYIQLQQKLPFILLIGFLMARTTIKKRTKARQAEPIQPPEAELEYKADQPKG